MLNTKYELKQLWIDILIGMFIIAAMYIFMIGFSYLVIYLHNIIN